MGCRIARIRLGAPQDGPKVVSASQRAKGIRWERAVARDLTEATGIEHKRVLDEPREGNRGDVRSSLPYVYQCKSGARPDIYGAVREATIASDPGQIPVAAIHRTGRGGEKLAVLRWSDWLALATHIRILSIVREGEEPGDVEPGVPHYPQLLRRVRDPS